MRIPSLELLRALAADPIGNFTACRDIALAGPAYKVRGVICLGRDPAHPLDDYVLIRRYADSYAIASFFTEDAALLDEAAQTLVTLRQTYAEIELRSQNERVFAHPYLAASEPTEPPNPVYFIRTADALKPVPMDAGVSVGIVSAEDLAELADGIAGRRWRDDEIPPDVLDKNPVYRDTRLYLLRVRGEIAGYLRAECGFANIYDVGWIFVRPEFRGRGLGKQLTAAFARDTFARGDVPHYGWAVSEISAATARACGFVTNPLPICRLLCEV